MFSGQYLHIYVNFRGRGCEAAAHAARLYLTMAMTENHVLVKIDFKNAFNCLNREQILKVTHQHNPALFEYIKASYSAPSYLFYGDHIITSETGAKQGDPEGHLQSATE